jgi:hypothetical protein
LLSHAASPKQDSKQRNDHGQSNERTLRAEQLSDEIKDAFIDALEAWGLIENQLFMIFQFIADYSHIDLAWTAFVEIGSVSAQRQKVRDLAQNLPLKLADMEELDRLLKRLKNLSTKRNALVHGRWAERTVIMLDDATETEEVIEEQWRLYDTRDPMKARPTNYREEDVQRGKSRFSVGDMRRAESEFRQLAKEMFHYMERLMSYASIIRAKRHVAKKL